MNITCNSCLKSNFLNTVVSLSNTCKFCNDTLLSKSVIHGNQDNLYKFLKDDLLTVINFWAPWCGPCRNFSPIFEKTSKKYREKIRFIKVNIESECTVSKNFDIKKVPTIFLYKDEKKIGEFLSGLYEISFIEWLENYLK